jgi:hypothetical protein
MNAWKTTLYRGNLPALGTCSIYSIEHVIRKTCSWRTVADMMPNGARYIPASDCCSQEDMIARWEVQRFEKDIKGLPPFFYITPFTHFYMENPVWDLVDTSAGEVARFRVRNVGSKSAMVLNMPTEGHTFGCPTQVGWLFRKKWEGCTVHVSKDAYDKHCRRGGRYNVAR